ncbi:MAG: amidohydrolase family protein, partial [Candidatus Acidiferrales bacterium]
MTKASWLLSLVLLFCGGARGRTQQPGPIALTHVTVIDMTGAPPKSDMTVVIQTDRIVAVGRSSKTHPPKNARIIDARHKYLIPGLWDMHIHNFFGPNRSFYSLYIANGVTGVRDMGGEWKYYDADEQELRAGRPLNGRWPAPRMVAAGVILDGKPPVHPTDVSVTNAEEARAAVDMCKGHGVDFIKVYNLLNRESYFAIADEAKKDGLPFVGHVPFTVSAADASDAGQKSIEHSDGILLASSTKESELREQLLKELREKGFSFGLYNLTEGAAIESYDRQKA